MLALTLEAAGYPCDVSLSPGMLFIGMPGVLLGGTIVNRTYLVWNNKNLYKYLVLITMVPRNSSLRYLVCGLWLSASISASF